MMDQLLLGEPNQMLLQLKFLPLRWLIPIQSIHMHVTPLSIFYL